MKKDTKATITTPVKELSRDEEMMHYNAVQFEEIRSTMRVLIEGMEGIKATLEKRMDRMENKLDAWIAKLSSDTIDLKSRSEDHEKRITTLEAART